MKSSASPTLASLFPHASASTVAANPWLAGNIDGKSLDNALQANLKRLRAKRGVMNKTEAEFSMMLEAQKRNGEILRYEFEGLTLRWADMRYTPDFVVFQTPTLEIDMNREEFKTSTTGVKLIEVKGGHIWDRDIVRFKGARAYWPEFSFEMHQKTKQGWKRKY